MRVVADLHNHSCLSPCASLDNSPLVLARTASKRGIALMALTDHNSAKNCPAFADACRRYGIFPAFGTETTSSEEVHVLSLFGELDAAREWGDLIYSHLPPVANDPELVGDQPVVDVDEGILEFEERFLLSAVDLSLADISRLTLERGGLCIPAHVDRRVNSITSQLGILPDTPFSALEVTHLPPRLDTRGLPLVCSSDAHYPDDIGRRSFSFVFPGAPADGSEVFQALCTAIEADGLLLDLSG